MLRILEPLYKLYLRTRCRNSSLNLQNLRVPKCVGLLLFCASFSSNAHVKWFADWSIATSPPRNPMMILSMPLWQIFFLLCVAVMTALGAIDAKLSYRLSPYKSKLEKLHCLVMPHAMLALRIGLSLYWIMVAWTVNTPVFLTPELSAPQWIRWAQTLCAVTVLLRSTSWIAGLGMLSFFAAATYTHGWFHLLDYPLFLGIGIILVLPKLRGKSDDLLALDILRGSAAITLLWGGIEKFAYPDWSFELLISNTALSLGVSPETAMYMYGFGELAMSFALLLFSVGSQVSALLMLIVFLVAVIPFGWIDFVGHSGIVVALLLLCTTQSRIFHMSSSSERNAIWHGSVFASSVLFLWALYMGLHNMYSTQNPSTQNDEVRIKLERALVRAKQSE